MNQAETTKIAPPPREARWVGAWIAAFALVQLSVAAQLDIFGDDLVYLPVTRNEWRGIIHDFRVLPIGYWQPTTLIAYRIGNALWGLAPLYSIAGTILHFVNVWLLWRLLVQDKVGFGLPRAIALAGTLVFLGNFAVVESVHTLQTAVHKLPMFFFLLGLNYGRAGIVDALFFAACLASKEYGVLYPLLAFGRDVCLRGGAAKRAARAVALPLLVATSFGCWTIYRIRTYGVFMAQNDVELSMDSVWLYMDQLGALLLYPLFPIRCNLIYEDSILQQFGMLDLRHVAPAISRTLGGVAWGVILGTIYQRGDARVRRLLAFGAGWLLLSVGVVSATSGEPVSRYLYLASAPAAILLALLLHALAPPSRRLALVVLLGVVAPWHLAEHAFSPAVQNLVHYSTAGKAQVYAFGDAYRGALLPIGSVVVLHGCEIPDDFPRRGDLMRDYLETLYPGTAFGYRLAEVFPVGTPSPRPFAPTYDFFWNDGRQEWVVRLRNPPTMTVEEWLAAHTEASDAPE